MEEQLEPQEMEEEDQPEEKENEGFAGEIPPPHFQGEFQPNPNFQFPGGVPQQMESSNSYAQHEMMMNQ